MMGGITDLKVAQQVFTSQMQMAFQRMMTFRIYGGLPDEIGWPHCAKWLSNGPLTNLSISLC